MSQQQNSKTRTKRTYSQMMEETKLLNEEEPMNITVQGKKFKNALNFNLNLHFKFTFQSQSKDKVDVIASTECQEPEQKQIAQEEKQNISTKSKLELNCMENKKEANVMLSEGKPKMVSGREVQPKMIDESKAQPKLFIQKEVDLQLERKREPKLLVSNEVQPKVMIQNKNPTQKPKENHVEKKRDVHGVQKTVGQLKRDIQPRHQPQQKKQRCPSCSVLKTSGITGKLTNNPCKELKKVTFAQLPKCKPEPTEKILPKKKETNPKQKEVEVIQKDERIITKIKVGRPKKE